MQVNFQNGKILSATLYDNGVVLRPGSPPFKKYRGSVDGISPGDTVEEALKVWGEPNKFNVSGTPDRQTIILDYKDGTTLTVWPPKIRDLNKAALQLLQLDHIHSQPLRSITVYLAKAST